MEKRLTSSMSDHYSKRNCYVLIKELHVTYLLKEVMGIQSALKGISEGT